MPARCMKNDSSKNGDTKIVMLSVLESHLAPDLFSSFWVQGIDLAEFQLFPSLQESKHLGLNMITKLLCRPFVLKVQNTLQERKSLPQCVKQGTKMNALMP
mmetsp:Transcript_11981/g.15677  ORF Transcript_11981/g.15677 Transcript_11981/m.15677 type:complete len:101 (-) Transcript_11981:462-764(-)